MAVAYTLFSSSSSAASSALRRSRFFTDSTSIPAPQVSLADPARTVFPSIRDEFLGSRIAFSPRRKKGVHVSVDGVDSLGSTYLVFCITGQGENIDNMFLFQNSQDADYVPMPIVLIDQESDSDATIVQISFGDRLGALIDTMKALKDLGLDVAKGTSEMGVHGGNILVVEWLFNLIGRATGRKVEDPDLLEKIRLTIINNLLKYHPESSERLAMGEAFGVKAPEKKLMGRIATHIHVKEDGPKRSLLLIETVDRPGLLLEIIKVIADININVESAEIETEGLVAKDKFHVSYGGAALNSSLSQIVLWALVTISMFENLRSTFVESALMGLRAEDLAYGPEISWGGWKLAWVPLVIKNKIKCVEIWFLIRSLPKLCLKASISLGFKSNRLSSGALASDPDPVQDFCIPNTEILHSNFHQCKNASAATVDDFVFSGIKNPGKKLGKSDFLAMPVNAATETAFVLEGKIYSGFIDSKNRVFAKVIEKGEVMVFPRGLLHFQMNVGDSPATIFGSFDSQNPGLVKIPNAVFGSEIEEELLEKAFGLRRADNHTVGKYKHHARAINF
ncbi:hypothetical protein C3L33_16831, partial [Rhododendron williamsianum]